MSELSQLLKKQLAKDQLDEDKVHILAVGEFGRNALSNFNFSLVEKFPHNIKVDFLETETSAFEPFLSFSPSAPIPGFCFPDDTQAPFFVDSRSVIVIISETISEPLLSYTTEKGFGILMGAKLDQEKAHCISVKNDVSDYSAILETLFKILFIPNLIQADYSDCFYACNQGNSLFFVQGCAKGDAQTQRAQLAAKQMLQNAQNANVDLKNASALIININCSEDFRLEEYTDVCELVSGEISDKIITIIGTSVETDYIDEVNVSLFLIEK